MDWVGLDVWLVGDLVGKEIWPVWSFGWAGMGFARDLVGFGDLAAVSYATDLVGLGIWLLDIWLG